MRIDEIRIHRKELPAVRSYTMSSADVGSPESIIVRLTTDTGLVGWGEACMATPVFQAANAPGIQAALEMMAPNLLGADPTRINPVHDRMRSVLDGNAEAKAVIDIACWDLLGKATGRSVADLLGGVRTDPVSTYHVIGIGEAADAAAQAEQLQRSGLRKLQLKAGKDGDIERDIASIRAVASVLRADTELAVDANRGWTTTQAIQVSQACADVRMSIEQPCKSYDACARVRPQLVHPLVLDESATDLTTIAKAITSGVADGFGLKLTRLGGLTAMRAARDLCAAAGVPISCDDAWGGDIIAAACVHLGATLEPEVSRGAWIAQPYVGQHYDPEHGPRIVGGMIPLPSNGPGLGLTIADDAFGQPEAVFGLR